MTMLIIIAAVGFGLVLAVGAAWETWRTAKRAEVAGRGWVRYRCRPADRRLAGSLSAECERMALPVIDPVWGDRWYLVEAPPPQITVLADRLGDRAKEAGFTVWRIRGRRVVLRRGLRLLTIESGR